MQAKYTSQILPALLKMMNEEKHFKLQYKAAASLTSFLGGLFDELDGNEEDDSTKMAMKKLIAPYSDQIVLTISSSL